MESSPIASASEKAVYCSLYYALLILRGCAATIVQNCKIQNSNCKIQTLKIKPSPTGCGFEMRLQDSRAQSRF